MARAEIDRRSVFLALAGSAAASILPNAPAAARTRHVVPRVKPVSFDSWVAAFRAKAEAHGITEATYTRVMTGLKPDMTGLKEIRDQPEFH